MHAVALLPEEAASTHMLRHVTFLLPTLFPFILFHSVGLARRFEDRRGRQPLSTNMYRVVSCLERDACGLTAVVSSWYGRPSSRPLRPQSYRINNFAAVPRSATSLFGVRICFLPLVGPPHASHVPPRGRGVKPAYRPAVFGITTVVVDTITVESYCRYIMGHRCCPNRSAPPARAPRAIASRPRAVQSRRGAPRERS